MTNIHGIRAAFNNPLPNTPNAGPGERLREAIKSAVSDDGRVDFIERGEMRSQFIKLFGAGDEGAKKFDELMAAVASEGVSTDKFRLIDQAFANLQVPVATPHVLKGIPDGTYQLKGRFLDQDRTFTIVKSGNGATINGMPIQANGTIHFEDRSHQSEQWVTDGKVELLGDDVISLQLKQQHIYPMLGKTNVSEWEGAVKTDGTNMTPDIERKTIKVQGQSTMTSLAAEARGRQDTSRVSAEVTLITNGPDKLFIKIPRSVTRDGDITVPVGRDGRISHTEGNNVYTLNVSGRLEQGHLKLRIASSGSTLATNTDVEGAF